MAASLLYFWLRYFLGNKISVLRWPGAYSIIAIRPIVFSRLGSMILNNSPLNAYLASLSHCSRVSAAIFVSQIKNLLCLVKILQSLSSSFPTKGAKILLLKVSLSKRELTLISR